MALELNAHNRRRGPLTLAALALAVALAGPAYAESAEFAKVRADVAQSYPDIRHVGADEFAKLAEKDSIVLDARAADEYAVSHLPGAVRIEPGISATAFRKQFAGKLEGKTVLVYCSVGVRSSRLATTIGSEVKAAGGTGVANLAGGIFGWHNEKRPLVDANGPTDYVHAYSETWGRVLSRPELIRTGPARPN
jgi:rhodanese-related sulfurtransferase